MTNYERLADLLAECYQLAGQAVEQLPGEEGVELLDKLVEAIELADTRNNQGAAR